MCGIVGYFTNSKGDDDILILKKLMRESRIRGIHSFGISYFDGAKIVTEKYHEQDYKKMSIPVEASSFIYHNRYSTSGDYIDHRNNQPLSIEGTSLVFNGVLDMGTKNEMQERWGIEMETENDGEILLRKCDFNPVLMVEFIKNVGSFSGLVLQGNSLYALTNGMRPLWYWEFNKSVFFASTKDIFTRAIPYSTPKMLPANILHEWRN